MMGKNNLFTSEQMATASLVMAALAYNEVPCGTNASSAANASARAYADMKAKEMMTNAGIEETCLEALRECKTGGQWYE